MGAVFQLSGYGTNDLRWPRWLVWRFGPRFSKWVGSLAEHYRRGRDLVNHLEAPLQRLQHVGFSEHLIHGPVGCDNDRFGSYQTQMRSFNLGWEWVMITPQFQEFTDPGSVLGVQVVQEDDLLAVVAIPPLVVLLDVHIGVFLADTPALPDSRRAPDPLVLQCRDAFRLLFAQVIQCQPVCDAAGILQ